jgi:hypothetical protein
MEEYQTPFLRREVGFFVFNQPMKVGEPLMKKLISLLSLVLLLLSLSCSSGGSSSGGSSGYISGNWSGQWISTRYRGQGGAVTANFQQSGNQISGSVSATNTALGDVTGNVSGTISNSDGPGTINMGVAWTKGGSVTYNGDYNNTKISGSYSASNGDIGTFVLTR